MLPDENTITDNIERNIDIAIEAQDGKAETTPTENKEGEDGTQQQPQDRPSGDGDSGTQPKPKQEGAPPAPSAPHPKDLKLQDGTVVKGGPERRFYEQREVARAQLHTKEQELNNTRNQLAQVQNELAAVQQSVQSLHGIAPDQLALGARIIVDLQRDPQGTLKKLLAEAAAQGYSIDDIGSGVDMAAIQRMIDERLPQQDNNEYQSDEEILDEAANEANAFFGRHPDARPHDKLLATVLRDHPGLDLEDAYYQVRDAFIEKGYDWSLTLEQNVGVVGADPANAGGQQQQNRAPLPAGNNAANAPINSAEVTTLASDDMDTGDIVRQAMRESGLNI